jgi:subtilisin family serine protease
MKRTILAALCLSVATAAFATEAQRYLVATKRPMRTGALAAVRQTVSYDLEERAVVPFESFNGFAAELTESEVAALRASNEVRWVEPVVERHKLEVRSLDDQTVPYGINKIFAPLARTGRAAGSVNVVVIDTGVDYRHPELAAVWQGGFNIFTETNDPLDDDGHGTHVAGTIGAADNGFGVIGVAPSVKLWSVKVLNEAGTGTSEGLIKAIDWVVQKKAALGGNWVINLSLGSNSESPGEREAFQRAADAGILTIAAAGNASSQDVPAPVAYPAAYPSVAAVAATTATNEIAYFSSQGPEVDFAAPGVGVLSTARVGSTTLSYIKHGDLSIFGTGLVGAKRGVVTGDIVYCGYGFETDFTAAVKGKIALIKRGENIDFSVKTRRAKEAGAIGVAIFNNRESSDTWTLFSNSDDEKYEWPVAVRLSQAAGEALLKKGAGLVTLAHTADDYVELSGTSMSCPHVVGSAALLWTLAPNATPAQILNALITTATDLGTPGHDSQFGAGLINVNAAARMLAPSAFGGITTGRPLGRRGRK